MDANINGSIEYKFYVAYKNIICDTISCSSDLNCVVKEAGDKLNQLNIDIDDNSLHCCLFVSYVFDKIDVCNINNKYTFNLIQSYNSNPSIFYLNCEDTKRLFKCFKE